MLADVDILVVGAGPTGLYAAYYAGFRGLSVAVMDSLPEPGGQVTALYPEKLIFDVAGLPAVKGRDLVSRLVDQAAAASPQYLLGHQATGLARRADGALHLTTANGDLVRCRAVVLSGGIGTFSPRALPGGEPWVGRGVEYFIADPTQYAGRDVVVVGGGDSAVDWCLMLSSIAASVRLVHRRDRFRAHAASVEELAAVGVEVLTPFTVQAFHGGPRLKAVDITRVKAGDDVRRLECDAVIAALGFIADLGPLQDWGLDICDGHVRVDSRMATNLPCVYAAGDITEYTGKVRLISVGFGEAATAVNNAAVAIDPGRALFPGHSSDADAA